MCSRGRWHPRGRTAATSSRLLYDVIGAIYDWVGFDIVDDPVSRALVIAGIAGIAGIAEPTSKLNSLGVLADVGAEPMSYRTIQRHLAMIKTGGCRDAIAARCFTHAQNRGAR